MSNDQLKRQIQEKDLHRREASERARSLRAKNKDMSSLPLGGKSAKMGEHYMFNDDGSPQNEKAASDAYDHTMNLRESEAEDQEERARRAGKDQGELGKSWKQRFGG